MKRFEIWVNGILRDVYTGDVVRNLRNIVRRKSFGKTVDGSNELIIKVLGVKQQ